MRYVRRTLTIVGAILAFVGLFWLGQGMGIIRWPASSFMIDQYLWVITGSVTAALGLLLILIARRLPRR
ncbi:hypothetical protein QLH51_04995 [Sphingomonas sp. 2R-10]|uniref:hypothetical protein n=1 Tax=Sphingomonas sp. 2R-10 TaxID=3045148 RepID=UPI000F7A5892|nr:hypothetical protein [Sphingomonas sp. 2R-10]MDJ0276162.1 hypothetical protein [Sphingomonas sp. 2R-10]